MDCTIHGYIKTNVKIKIYYKVIINLLYTFFHTKNTNIIIQTYYTYVQNKFLLKIHNCILIFLVQNINL